jgi:CubicO group peptidase (beta-lactamase class C family)
MTRAHSLSILSCAFVLYALAGCVAAPLSPSTPPSPDPARSRQLEETLARYNESVHAPAWAAAVVKDGRIIAVAGIGVRNQQTGAPLDVDSARLHWGSISKSVTATMLAGLVKDGVLSWNTTLSEVFKGMPMREEYRRVTLVELMNHRADLPAYTQLGPAQAQQFRGYTGTAMERRDAFVRDVLQEPPPARASDALVYSNAGPAVAAHAAEVATGRSWEDLVRTQVFDRIGMKSAGFGLPAAVEETQTRGHAGPNATSLNVMGANPTPGSPLLDAAGNIHSTVFDLALYARAHLLGLQGKPGPLDVASVRALHTPPSDGRTLGPAGEGYAMGWGLRRENGQLVHWHNGSAGQFFAQVDLFPEAGLAIVVMTNSGFPGRGAPELVRQIRMLYVE